MERYLRKDKQLSCIGKKIVVELKKDNYLSIDDLFAEWQEQHQLEKDEEYLKYKGGHVPKDAFLPDGIIEEKQFEEKKNNGSSVLFIAKEAYWYTEEESEEKCRESLNNPVFWHREVSFGRVPETMFSKRLSMLINSYYSQNYQMINKEHFNLQSCAVMNLNKRGGFAYCKWETLEGYVSTYCKYIEKEISLIKPDLIICCGSSVKWLIEKYIDIDENIKIVSVSHPSYFALSDTEYLNQFKCSIEGVEWVYNRNSNKEVEKDVDIKGIMFDTNKSYSNTATFDMLTADKISAYDGAGKYIESFNIGDIVLYYIKGLGIVAAGEICSKTNQCEYHGSIEKYKMVKMITPINMPKNEGELKNITPADIKRLLNRNFYWASTIKTPFLDESQCKCLVDELKKLYGE